MSETKTPLLPPGFDPKLLSIKPYEAGYGDKTRKLCRGGYLAPHTRSNEANTLANGIFDFERPLLGQPPRSPKPRRQGRVVIYSPPNLATVVVGYYNLTLAGADLTGHSLSAVVDTFVLPSGVEQVEVVAGLMLDDINIIGRGWAASATTRIGFLVTKAAFGSVLAEQGFRLDQHPVNVRPHGPSQLFIKEFQPVAR